MQLAQDFDLKHAASDPQRHLNVASAMQPIHRTPQSPPPPLKRMGSSQFSTDSESPADKKTTCKEEIIISDIDEKGCKKGQAKSHLASPNYKMVPIKTLL